MALVFVQHSYLSFMATKEFLPSFDRYFWFTSLSSIASASPVLVLQLLYYWYHHHDLCHQHYLKLLHLDHHILF